MDKAEPEHAQKLERIYARRAKRTRRAKFLGAVLLALTGMVLTVSLRMNPGLAEQIVAWSHGTDVPYGLRDVDNSEDVEVRTMPKDVVPVRRGSTLSGG